MAISAAVTIGNDRVGTLSLSGNKRYGTISASRAFCACRRFSAWSQTAE